MLKKIKNKLKHWFKRPLLYYTVTGDAGFYRGQRMKKKGIEYVVLHYHNESPGFNQKFLHPLIIPLHCVSHFKYCYNRAEKKIATFLRMKISNVDLPKVRINQQKAKA